MKKQHPTTKKPTYCLSAEQLRINLNALNSIQMALLLIPTSQIAQQLKHQFGIMHMTEREIYIDLQNPYSLLRKYLTSIMKSLVSRCLMLLDESFKQYLNAKRKADLMNLEELLEEIKIRHYLRRNEIEDSDVK